MATSIERHRQRFRANPRDREAFAALESSYFLHGAWVELLSLYEQRLSALAQEPAERARLLHRLGQVLEERLERLQEAAARYREAARADPEFAAPLRQLRRLEARRGRPEVALQIAELEAARPLRRYERIALHCEVGELWGHALGDPGQALEHFRRALELDPKSTSAQTGVAWALEALGQCEQAIAAWERALERLQGPDRGGALLALARLLESASDPARRERALALYREAAELAPVRREALEGYARLARAAGLERELAAVAEERFRLARGASRRVDLALEAYDLLFHRLGDPAGARLWLERARELAPEDPRVERAQEAFDQDEVAVETVRLQARASESAIAPEEKALRWCELARHQLERLEDEEAARTSYERALEADPRCAEALAGLEPLLEKAGEAECWRRRLQRAADAERGPARIEWLCRLGESWLSAPGHAEEALHAFEQACRELVQDQSAGVERSLAARAWSGRARALEELGDTEALAEALAALAEWVEGDERASVWRRLGFLHAAEGETERAIEAWRRSLRERPGDEAVLAALAAAFDERGRLEEAIEVRRELAARLPPPARVRCLAELARDLAALGRHAEAASRLREVTALDPELDEAWEALGTSLRASEDREALVEWAGARAERERDPERRARLLLERADGLEALGRTHEARDALQAVAEARDVGEALRTEAEHRLEALLERAGEAQELARRLEARLAGAPPQEAVELRARLARLAERELRDSARAVTHLEAALALAPERGDLWQALGRIHAREGRPAACLRAIEGELAASPPPEREHALREQALDLCRHVLVKRQAAGLHARRLLELDPNHPEALVQRADDLEGEGSFDAALEHLERRLDVLTNRGSRDPQRANAEIETRLRIARLRSEALGDLRGALEVLEPLGAQAAERPEVAEALAPLLERHGRHRELAQLCQAVAERAHHPADRARWFAWLGRARMALGQPDAAAEALRRALLERPDDREVRGMLAEAYRALGEHGPLARLLELELSTRSGSEELPLRRELVELLAGDPQRRDELWAHLCRILELEPTDREALTRVVAMAPALGRAERALALVAEAEAHEPERGGRAELAALRAELLSGALGRSEQAVAAWREALALAPGRHDLRRRLRLELERAGRLEEALVELAAEFDRSPQAERRALAEHGLALAGSDPALARGWLARLRALAPNEPSPWIRLAELERRAGRWEACAAALARAADGSRDARERLALWRESARVLEEHLGAPARAAVALEPALELEIEREEVLRELDRLETRAGRHGALARVLEERIRIAPSTERWRHRIRLGELRLRALGDAEGAERELRAALGEPGLPEPERRRVLPLLGEALERQGRIEQWARVAEAELRGLPREDRACRERRLLLSKKLARAYDGPLARPREALPHLREWVDGGEGPERDSCAARLLELLRAHGSPIELARRLEVWLATHREDFGRWLELARLREEKLGLLHPALEAYQRALALQPDSAEALRGARRCSERLRDWRATVELLEREGKPLPGRSPAERASALRRLGAIAARELGELARATRAYAAALEIEPQDLDSLRQLQRLLEAAEDWEGAIALYRSEIDVLGDREPGRRQTVWLRVAQLALERLRDDQRAADAFEAAEAIAPVPARARWRWARALERLGRSDAALEQLERWCEEPGSGAGAADRLEVARRWAEQGETARARARLARVLGEDPSLAEGWRLAAELAEREQRSEEAAQAWSRAAELTAGEAAAEAWLRSARLLEASAPDRACELLEAGSARLPGHALLAAKLACLAESVGRRELAVEAALRASRARAGSAAPEFWAARLAGARSALALRCPETALELLEGVEAEGEAELESNELRAEAWHALGEWERAGALLERILSRADRAVPAERRAGWLRMHAESLEARGAFDRAVAAYERWIEIEPNSAAARAGRTRCLEALERWEEAAESLREGAGAATESSERARLLVRAARIERRIGRLEPAESALCQATELNPDTTEAWRELAEVRLLRGNAGGARRAAQAGLERVGPSSERAPLLRALGEAHEREGRLVEAASSYAEAARTDPTATTDALGSARLWRRLGRWEEAAQVLRRFLTEGAPQPGPERARVALELGRLLAGPLEQIEAAIAAYRCAIEADPELVEAREVLADLLTHRPEREAEAIALHAQLLAADPTRARSLRALTRIAERRRSPLAADGRLMLRALGEASADEAERSAPRLSFPVASPPRLDDPLGERLREAVQRAAEPLARALGATGHPQPEPGSGALGRFRAACLAAEGQLAAPALVPLPDEEVAETVRVLALVALGAEALRADAARVNAITAVLGTRMRRRLRRTLRDLDPKAVEGLDLRAWRASLRVLAAAVALDASGGDLETALRALAAAEAEDETPRLEGPERRVWIAASPLARGLLERTLRIWIEQLSGPPSQERRVA